MCKLNWDFGWMGGLLNVQENHKHTIIQVQNGFHTIYYNEIDYVEMHGSCQPTHVPWPKIKVSTK